MRIHLALLIYFASSVYGQGAILPQGPVEPPELPGPSSPPGLPGLSGSSVQLNETLIRDIVREEIEIALQKFRNSLTIPTERRHEDDWTVFQRRMDGSVNFYRRWNEYVNGFGNKSGEFWLGLEELHRLTECGNYELRIDMIVTNGTYLTAKYSDFKIGPSSSAYKLTATGYSGNATDSLHKTLLAKHSHNNQRFSAIGADNDNHYGFCATDWKGGWWYNACLNSNLNGMYNHFNNARGVSWKDQRRYRYMFMSFTEMKFRPRRE